MTVVLYQGGPRHGETEQRPDDEHELRIPIRTSPVASFNSLADAPSSISFKVGRYRRTEVIVYEYLGES